MTKVAFLAGGTHLKCASNLGPVLDLDSDGELLGSVVGAAAVASLPTRHIAHLINHPGFPAPTLIPKDHHN